MNMIHIRCRFKGYKYLVCDKYGQFWILPHKSGKMNIPLRKKKIVKHGSAKQPHINYKSDRISLNALKGLARVVNQKYKTGMADEKKLPF